MAAQCLMFPDLERFAWNLRTRCYRTHCYEVVGQGWYDFYQHSGPPDDIGPAKEAPSPTVVVANTPAGTLSSRVLMMPAPHKLLVWAFVSGLAEKLVPDVPNRLTAKTPHRLRPSSRPPLESAGPLTQHRRVYWKESGGAYGSIDFGRNEEAEAG